jgi:hypothetical protein
MIGFWVFLALAVPVAVHIFSRSEGKVVPFPFVGLLPKRASPNELQIQLRQKWLFLARLLLVASACAFLTFALLSDWWSESWLKQSLVQKLSLPPSPPTLIITQDWWELSSKKSQQALLSALISEQDIAQTKEVILIHYANSKAKISRFDKTDFIKRMQQNRVFSIADQDNAASDATDPIVQQKLINNIWSVVHAISTTLPIDSLIHIYTSNRYSQFTGARPNIDHVLQWHIRSLPENNSDEIKPIKVAILKTKEQSASSQNSFLLEQALKSLALVHPIDVEIIGGAVAEKTTTQKQRPSTEQINYTKFDTLLLDFALNDTIINDQTDYPNAVRLSSLPPPNTMEFIAELGQVIFAKRQYQQDFFQASIANEKIKDNNGANISNVSVISTLPNTNESPWQMVLTLILLILFVLERLMSESINLAKTAVKLNAHE